MNYFKSIFGYGSKGSQQVKKMEITGQQVPQPTKISQSVRQSTIASSQFEKSKKTTQSVRQTKNTQQDYSQDQSDQYYSQILGIKAEQASQLKKLKQAFRKKIRQFSNNRVQRVAINEAYFIMARKVFKVDQPQIKFIKNIVRGKVNNVWKALLKKQYLLKYKTKGDNYPILYHAVRSGHYDIVEMILQLGCSLDFSNDISTPMHCAAYYGHYSLIPLLLKYGVPTTIKNSFSHLPIQQACSKQIQLLLKNAKDDSILKLSEQLLKQKKAINIINIEQQKQIVIKKIILKNYQCNFKDYEDTFHGTSFKNLKSIAQNGLKKAGDQIGEKTLEVVGGHIKLGVTINGIKNWSSAVFVSPSIYYAANPVYAKQHINNTNQVWLPVIQAKIKTGFYTRHDHTFRNYNFATNEPTNVQYRVKSQIHDQQNLIMRAENPSNVVVVALMFLKKGFLEKNQDYDKATSIVLSSPQEIKFAKNHIYENK